MTERILTADELFEIAASHACGVPLQNIAKRHGVSVQRIAALCERKPVEAVA